MGTLKPRPLYDILVEGPFSPESIIVEMQTGLLKRTPESEAYLDEKWDEAIAGGLKPWPNDTKPSRYHFFGAEVTEDAKLVIQIDPSVSYRDYYCAGRTPEFRQEFGEEYAPMSFSSSITVIAKNRRGELCVLVCHRNPEKVDACPGYITIGASGAISIKSNETSLDAALREGKEEAGIQPHEFTKIMCFGLMRDHTVRYTETMFVGFTDVSVEELSTRTHDDENTIAYVPIETLCKKWLMNIPYAITENSLGLGLVIGKAYFGVEWLSDMEYELQIQRGLADTSERYEEFVREDTALLAEMIQEFI